MLVGIKENKIKEHTKELLTEIQIITPDSLYEKGFLSGAEEAYNNVLDFIEKLQ